MFNWKLKDVIMVCIFSVVFSFIYLWAVYLANFMATLLAPFGLAPYAYEIVFGVWFMAFYICSIYYSKSWSSYNFRSFICCNRGNYGNMFGPIVILSGIIQGMGPELVFCKKRL